MDRDHRLNSIIDEKRKEREKDSKQIKNYLSLSMLQCFVARKNRLCYKMIGIKITSVIKSQREYRNLATDDFDYTRTKINLFQIADDHNLSFFLL